MDQKRIGKFISERRRARNLTQRQLADVLSISDKTISKWECGNGMPEVSLMLPLCKALGINVNELLSGECLGETQYFEKAENNMLDLVKDRTSARTKIMVANVSATITVLSALALTLTAGFASIPIGVRLLLVAIALMVIVSDVAVIVLIAVNTEIYECAACGEKFVPTLSAYIWGPHTMKRRRLKCPYCGKRCWNKSHIRK